MEPESPRGPNINFPPPLIYALAFVAGYLLQRIRPLPMSDRQEVMAWLRWAGLSLLLLWVLLSVTAAVAFRRAHTTVLPNRPASALITSGPFAITRNPLYVAMALLYIGGTLLVNSWWPIALLPVSLVVMDRAVIAREERYLASAFPEEYAVYRSRVRRWL